MNREWRRRGFRILYVFLLLAVCSQKAGGTQQNAVPKDTAGQSSAGQEYTAREVQPADAPAEEETKEEIPEAGEKKKIALTFDDGPSASCTPVLLDGLKERDVHATFFLIGENIEKGENAKIVRRMYEEGHLIGNHTYHHVEITRVGDETAYQEIKMTNEVIEAVTGEPVEYMRPPFGAWQKKLEQRIHVLPVMWTIDPLDWTTENIDEIVNKVVTEAEEDDIILLHDCYMSSVKAALRIVDLLEAEDFEFVTVDELILE